MLLLETKKVLAPMAQSGKTGNKRLSNLYYNRVMNNAEIDTISQIMDEEFIFTIPTHPEVFKGTKGFEEEVTGLHGAFPDVHLNVHHKWCFDDLILGLWTGTGTHNGDVPLSTPQGPLPATGNKFVIEGVSWIRADGVLLRENLANEDTLKIIHDLGVKDCSELYKRAGASLASSSHFPTNTRQTIASQEHFAYDFKFNHPLLLQEGVGRLAYDNFMKTYWSAFDDVQVSITEAKRDRTVNAYRWTFTAKHTGDFFGIPATGKSIHHQGVTVWINNGQAEPQKAYFNENLIVLLGQIQD